MKRVIDKGLLEAGLWEAAAGLAMVVLSAGMPLLVPLGLVLVAHGGYTGARALELVRS